MEDNKKIDKITYFYDNDEYHYLYSGNFLRSSYLDKDDVTNYKYCAVLERLDTNDSSSIWVVDEEFFRNKFISNLFKNNI